jgi:hypothetical protein
MSSRYGQTALLLPDSRQRSTRLIMDISVWQLTIARFYRDFLDRGKYMARCTLRLGR